MKLPDVVYFPPRRYHIPGIFPPIAYKPIAYRPAKKYERYYIPSTPGSLEPGSAKLHRAFPNTYPLPVVIVKRIQNQKEGQE